MACIIGGLMTAGFGVLLLFSNDFGDKLKRDSYDLPFKFRQIEMPEGVVIIYLDDASHKILNQQSGDKWNRALHAQLLHRLKADQAKVVVFDILFDEPGPSPEADQELADAIQAHGKVILCSDYLESDVRGVPMKEYFLPIPKLRAVAAGLGLSKLKTGKDGVVRPHPPPVDSNLSLAQAAAKAVDAPNLDNPALATSRRWLNYYGPAGTIENVSYHSALATNGVAAGYFKDKVVFVGARQSAGYTGQGKDEYGNAFTWIYGTYSTGVEIHATAFLNLMRGDWLKPLHPLIQRCLILGGGFAFGFGLTRLRNWLAPLVAIVGILLVAGLAWLLFRYQLIWFAWLILVVQIVFALIWSAVYNSIQAYVEKQILESSLEMHLPPARVKQLLRRPELLKPGAEKQMLSIMFTDIADFSTISERMLPEKLFQHLNRYFQETISCVHKEDGTVVKLIGDAIFSIWNAPEPQANHQELACRAALLLRDKVVEFNTDNISFPFHTRVGLHTGEACVGNCGSGERFDYTAIGSNINLASRLEALNKHVGTSILASDVMVAAVEDLFTTRSVGHFRLKGADRILEVFELIGPAGERESTKEWRQTFESALLKFRQSQFDEAEAGFQKVIAMRGKDGPSSLYLMQIQAFRTTPPPHGWFGEVRMEEK